MSIAPPRATRLFVRLRSSLLALALAGCAEPTVTTEIGGPALNRVGAPGTHLQYGVPVKVGDGRARTYVILDQKQGGAPLEIGVALDERALEGLPAHVEGHGAVYDLAMPAQNPTAFQFVELDWNPGGHEPPGVYDTPHFDFHFYTISQAVRATIDPATNPNYAAEANRLPAAQFIPPFYVVPAPPGVPPAAIAVPHMGVHWSDVRSPELQMLFGNPGAYRPFTSTFIIGSWNGQVIFWEPMITLQHLLAKRTTTDAAVRDQLIPIPTPAQYQIPGYYPSAYRITWDAKAKEYRVALARLARAS